MVCTCCEYLGKSDHQPHIREGSDQWVLEAHEIVTENVWCWILKPYSLV